jgi:Tol biopolymer transport system component
MSHRRHALARSMALLIGGTLLVAPLSCSSDSSAPTGPNDPPADDGSAAVVTEPVLLVVAPSASRLSPMQLLSIADEEVSYVSFPPGSQPEADTAEVVNRTRDLATGGPMVDGGLDPIPVPASIGDTLVITTYRQGLIFTQIVREVPDGIPPVIVRTNPPRGKTRVPLNWQILVVFSEPVDGATVTPTSVKLLRSGQPVPIQLVLAADGLSLEVVPDAALEPAATHSLVVETELADRIGDMLESQFTSEFTTVPAQLVGEIVFESGRSGAKEVWTMKTDGSDLFQITDRIGGGQSTGPALSPDGRKVAFSLADPTNGDEWDIYVINVDGTGLTRLTTDPAFDGWRPAWSPDGQEIAFFSTRDDPLNDEIYVMNADGSNVRRLTNNPADDAHPAWSPDGSEIAFVTNRDGDFDIYLMNADGSNPTPLTVDPANEDWPAWSPDGTKIAFDTFRDGDREIYTINVDGTGLMNLTNDPGFDSAPAWSPDGTKIAFISDRAGPLDIWIMNADGSSPVNLTNDGFADFFPSWSP